MMDVIVGYVHNIILNAVLNRPAQLKISSIVTEVCTSRL